MNQELTTPPPLFPELSLERFRSTCRLKKRFDGHAGSEMIILAALVSMAGTVLLELLFMNSEAMQIAQATYHLLCGGQP